MQLKEFFSKFARDVVLGSGVEETISFQLRKRDSAKPHAFVDVSICVFEGGVYAHSVIGLDTWCLYNLNLLVVIVTFVRIYITPTI